MSDLEQRIKEAAESLVKVLRDERPDRELSLDESFNRSCATPLSYYCLASPANILALLAEKDAEIERLGVNNLRIQDDIAGIVSTHRSDWSWDDVKEDVKDLTARAESAERERDEWKRIAGAYHADHLTLAEDLKSWKPCTCGICKPYDALVKGE